MKTMKTLVAVLIVLAMTLATVPVSVAADTATGMTEVTVGNGGTYKTYTEAISAIGGGNKLDGYYFKQVSDVVDGKIALDAFTNSATVVFDGQGFKLTVNTGFVCKSSSGTVNITLKNINATFNGTSPHPLVYARPNTNVVVDNCSTDRTFVYCFAFNNAGNAKITVNSGNYVARAVVFRTDYKESSLPQIELEINGGNFETLGEDVYILSNGGTLVNGETTEATTKLAKGMINPAYGRQKKASGASSYTTDMHPTNLKMTINGGTFKATKCSMFKVEGNTDLTINGGTFLLDGQSTGSVIFESSDKDIAEHDEKDKSGTATGAKLKYINDTSVTINGGNYIADEACVAYIWKSCDIAINGGFFWQNMAYSMIFARESASSSVTITDGVFYSPDLSNIALTSSNNTLHFVDSLRNAVLLGGTTKTAEKQYSLDIGNAVYYPTVAVKGTAACPSGNLQLSHSQTGSITVDTTPIKSFDNTASMYITDDLSVEVALDSNLNNAAFKGAYITMNKDYAGAALELTQALTVNKNGFAADGITASGAASVRQDLEGAKVYVQYSEKDDDGKFSARLVVGIDSLDYKGVGVKVTANSGVSDGALGAYAADTDKVKTFKVTNCYGSLLADSRTVTAREYGGSYFIAIEITGLTDSVDVRFNAYATVNGDVTQTGVQTITLAYPAGN